MNRHGPLGSRAIIAAGAVAGTTLAMVLGAGPADAATTVTLNGTVLTISGDSARNALSVGQTTAGVITLNGTPVIGGTVTANNLSRIVMDGGTGDDTLQVDETNGVMTPAIELHGGAGNDQLFGASGADTLDGGPGIDTLVGNAGADTLLGGAGNDKAIGGPGIDTVNLGEDSDQFTWSPGDGDDHLDGDTGKDTLIVNGFDRTASDPFEQETFQIRTAQGRNIITRIQLPAPNEPDDHINFAGFELLKALMAGGPNAVSFDSSFSASDVAVVRADLGPAVDPSQNQGIGNTAEAFGTTNADGIRIFGSPAAGLDITGLGPTELVTGAQNLDVRGNIDGGQGPAGDIIDASRIGPGTVDVLSLTGTDGNDTLIGSPGDDRLFGGDGDDRLEGRGGNDLLDGGTGNNVIIP